MLENKCSFCNRETPKQYLEDHHLTPRSKGGKIKVPVCCDCGDQIHNIFTNKELEILYNTVEAIRSHEKMRAWIKWIRKKKEFGFCMKLKKRV